MSAIIDSNPNFRVMTEDDLPSVMVIENLSYDYPWTENIFRDCLGVGYLCQLMEVEPEIISAYSVMSVASGESHLLNICVNKDQQGEGLGREMLSHSLQNASRLNASICFLEVRESNKIAIQLYHSMGFNQVGVRKDYYPADKGKEDALIFALQL